MAQIHAALHWQRLALETGRMVRAYVLRRRTVPEPDGETFQGQVTVRALTEH
jgi:hypothetical protein